MREKHFPKRPGGLNIHEKDLRQRFTSYHLKSVFLTLTIGNYEKNDIRGWLVLLLKEIIVCLQKKSIKHHFIDGLELLAYPSEKGSFKLQGGSYEYSSYEYSDEKNFFSSRVGEDCKHLENIFTEILEKLPENLSEVRADCLPKNKYYFLA